MNPQFEIQDILVFHSVFFCLLQNFVFQYQIYSHQWVTNGANIASYISYHSQEFIHATAANPKNTRLWSLFQWRSLTGGPLNVNTVCAADDTA